MYQHLTKLLLAGGVAVALLALGFVSILTPAWAAKPVKPSPNPIGCTAIDPFAKWNGSEWVCDPGIGVKGDKGDKGDTGDMGPAGSDTLGALICNDGEVAKFNASSATWECADVFPPDKLVFVTETVTTGDFSGIVMIGGIGVGAGLTSIAWADAICEAEATAAGLTGTFLPWLSTAALSPSGRFNQSPVPYLTTNDDVDNAVIAHDWAELTRRDDIWFVIDRGADGSLLYPGDLGTVWTGTDMDGTVRGPICGLWTDGSAGLIGATGVIDHTHTIAQRWTRGSQDGLWTSGCDGEYAFYCFEQ